MPLPKKLLLSLVLAISAIPAIAGPIVYVVSQDTNSGATQFGTVDLFSGAFTLIGPGATEGSQGLTQGSGGALLTLGFGGNLDSINRATGAASTIGATGLGDCSTPVSPCGPNSANSLVGLAGFFYATDLDNNLYTVNPTTGQATLKGATGISPLPYHLLATNPDGSTNTFDETLFTAGGNLFATFDANQINFGTFSINNVVAPSLYRINPATGIATRIGATANGLSAAVNVNGIVYAFDAQTSEILRLDPTNGNTTFVSNYDSSLLITGAAATPEPSSIALAMIGVAAMVARRRRSPAIKSAVPEN